MVYSLLIKQRRKIIAKKNVRYVKADSRHRVSLGKFIKDDSVLYKVYSDGEKIVLEPVKEILQEEMWLFKPENKELLESLKRGLTQKATIKKGSFAHYAE